MAKRSSDGLQKRGKYWWCRVPLVPGGPKKRRSTKCTDRAAARLAKAEFERQAADPTNYAANKTTLGAAILIFLEESKNRKLSSETLEMYDSKCRHIARVLGADRPLASVVATVWDEYVRTRTKEGASSHTIKKELIRGTGVLKAAKRRGLYPHDIDAVMPRYSAGYVPRKTWLPPEQIVRLLAELPIRRAAHVAFVIATGCRKKEAVRARREHYQDSGLVEIDGTKTPRAHRTIPVAPPFAKLMAFALQHAPGKDVLFEKWQNALRDIKAACRRAKVPEVSWNDLRRTHGSLLKQAGVLNETIAEILGHADTKMVEQVYGRDTPDALSARVRAIFDKGTQSTQEIEPVREESQKALVPIERSQASGAEGRAFESRVAYQKPREKPPVAVEKLSTGSTEIDPVRYKNDTVPGLLLAAKNLAESDHSEEGRLGVVELLRRAAAELF